MIHLYTFSVLKSWTSINLFKEYSFIDLFWIRGDWKQYHGILSTIINNHSNLNDFLDDDHLQLPAIIVIKTYINACYNNKMNTKTSNFKSLRIILQKFCLRWGIHNGTNHLLNVITLVINFRFRQISLALHIKEYIFNSIC